MIVTTLGREENRRVFQYGVGSSKVLVLTLELFEPSSLIRRDAGAIAGVDLGLSNPRPEGLERHAEQF